MNEKGIELNWAGQPIPLGGTYGGRPEHIPAHLSNSQKRAQSLDAFRQLIKKGMTECNHRAGNGRSEVHREPDSETGKEGWLAG